MATWRDRLQEASFRGIKFLTESSEIEVGRRLAVFEYPDRNSHDVLDLGKRTRSFTVTGYALGDNYDKVELALLSAAEKRGPGILIHPSYGAISVRCAKVRSTNSRNENGIATIEFIFVPDNSDVVNQPPADTGIQNEETARQANTQNADNFKKVQEATPKTRSFLDKTKRSIMRAGDAIRSARKDLEIVPQFVTKVQRFIGEAEALALDTIALAQLVQDIMTLAVFDPILESIAGSIDTIEQTQTPRSLSDLFKRQTLGFIDLLSFHSADTGTEDFDRYIRMMAASGVLALVTHIEFSSVEEATDFLNYVNDKLERLSLEETDDDALDLLEQTRALIVRDIEQRSLTLPRMGAVVLPQSIPALVLSNDVYGDADHETDILLRNNIADPLFLPPGLPLKVLMNV